MSTLTIPRDRLFAELREGDRITAIDGTELPEPREVLVVRVRPYATDRHDAVALVNPHASGVEWNLYPDSQVDRDVTIERAELAPQPPVPTQPRMTRRTRHGLTLTNNRPVEGGRYLRGWETEDRQYEIARGWAMTYCDGPHPRRWKDDQGVLHTGYCHGDEEHPYIVGWVISGPQIPGVREIGEPHPTFDDAWAFLAAALGKDRH